MKYFLLLFFFALQLVGFAQQKNYPEAVVAATKNDIVYKIINNPLSIAVTGYYNQDIVVKTSVGTIEYVSNNGYYLNVGKCSAKSVTISIYLKRPKSKLKLVGESSFNIRDFPKPHVLFSDNDRNGYISKEKLNSEQAVFFILPPSWSMCDISYNVIEYFVKHKHKDGRISIFKVTKTHVLTEEIKESFKKAEDGDTIMLYDVTVSGPNGIEKLTDELIFNVKEI